MPLTLIARPARAALLLAGSALWLAAAGCNSPSSDHNLNILIVNSSGQAVRVDIDGPGFPNYGTVINNGANFRDEVRGEPGDLLTFTVTDPAGVRSSAVGGCTASDNITVHEGEYGQVNIGAEVNGFVVICSSGWQ